MKETYTAKNASNDLAIVNWLLNAGTITQEDARWMRNYIERLK